MFLLRDVYEDMMLDGVRPTRETFHALAVGSMRGSRMHDAFFFKDQMKIMGLVPDVCTILFFLISFCLYNFLFDVDRYGLLNV